MHSETHFNRLKLFIKCISGDFHENSITMNKFFHRSKHFNSQFNQFKGNKYSIKSFQKNSFIYFLNPIIQANKTSGYYKFIKINSNDLKYYSKLNTLQDKSSYLEYKDPKKLDPQQSRFISGGVAIAVRNMKPLVRHGNVNGILKAYNDIKEKFPLWAIQNHWIPLHIQILQTFSKAGEIDACDQWFRNNFNTSYSPSLSMPSLTNHWAHYNTLMNAYSNIGNIDKVLSLRDCCFRDVPQSNQSVEIHTTILKAYIHNENIEEVENYFYSTFQTSIRRTWMNLIKNEKDPYILPTIQTYCLLLSFYSKFGLIQRAKNVYDACMRDLPNDSKSNSELHNGLMEAYSLSNGEFEMMSIFSSIFKSTLTSDTRKNRLLSTTYTFIIMMEFYLKKGDPKSVIFLYNLLLNDKRLFQNTKLVPQPKLYALLIEAYLEIDQVDEAISILYYRNVAHSIDIFLMVISYLADKGLIESLRPVIKHLEERFVGLPDEAIPLIVSAYCKKDLEGALYIFQKHFISPVDTKMMGSVDACLEVKDLDPLSDTLTSDTTMRSNKFTPQKQKATEDLILQLLESMAKFDYLDLLKLWIDNIQEQRFITLDMDVMNYLLLTLISNKHIESASSFSQIYFGGSKPIFVPNEKTIEIMKNADIYSYFLQQNK